MPLTQDELAPRRHRELADTSMPIMAEARDLLAQSGTIIVLADPSGVILETEGDRATQDAAADVLAGGSTFHFHRQFKRATGLTRV